MSTEQKVVLKLKDPLLTPSGENMKDTSDVDRMKIATLTKEDLTSLPNFTMGSALLALINGKKNCKDLEEMATMQRLLVKIRNKMLTDKGEWGITKDELVEIEGVFKSAPIAELNIGIHGQMLGTIQDLLRKTS